MRRWVGSTGLAAGLLLAAGPASGASSGGITSPGDGTAFNGDGTVTIAAQVGSPSPGATQLRLQGPTETGARILDERSSPGTLSYDLNTACATYPSGSCRGHVPAANGTYTVSLTGGISDHRSFRLQIPPQAPDSVSAGTAASGGPSPGASPGPAPSPSRGAAGGSVRVSWRLGDEPDLTGWSVYDGGGHLLAHDIGRGACGSGTCSTTVPASSDGGYRVRAYRSTCPGCGSVLQSGLSAEARLGAPGGPSPGQSGSPRASTPASTGPDPAAARAGQLAAFNGAYVNSPAPGAPLPPPAGTQPPYVTLPEGDGGFSPTLGYPAPRGAAGAVFPEPGPRPGGGGGAGVVAGGLLLLLAGAHLRVWSGRVR